VAEGELLTSCYASLRTNVLHKGLTPATAELGECRCSPLPSRKLIRSCRFDRRFRIYQLSDFGETIGTYKRTERGQIVDKMILAGNGAPVA
jgi:hypothetical protein